MFSSLLFLNSCDLHKNLNENDYLLVKNKFNFDQKASNEIEIEELENILKQKPNKRILGIFKFHLMLYNLPDSTRLQNKVADKHIKLEKKNVKITAKNVERRKKGKKNKDLKEYKPTFGEKLMTTIGEPPVILDTILTEDTKKQLNIYLTRKGYFNNIIKTKIILDSKNRFLFKKKKRTATVVYNINQKKPYRINKIDTVYNDFNLIPYIEAMKDKSFLKRNDKFDIDILDQERIRITKNLLDLGFAQFRKDFIKFYIDSNLNNNSINVSILFLKQSQKITKDSIQLSNHNRYIINDINILYQKKGKFINDKGSSFSNYNVSSYKDVSVFYDSILDVSSKLFFNTIIIRKGEFYSIKNEQNTLKKLNSLGLFRTIQIEKEIENDSTLSFKIFVTGIDRQGYKLEIDGTNTGSTFGIEGGVNYFHKNVFHGAERLSISLFGNLISQPLLINNQNDGNSNIPVEGNITNLSLAFNTIEFGPEITYSVPKALFINSLLKQNEVQTIFKTGINFERRLNIDQLDFQRTTGDISWGYQIKPNNYITHYIEPISLSTINIDKSEAFQSRLDDLNDQLLKASFESREIFGGNYSFTYNGKAKNIKRDPIFFKSNIELAGNLLRSIYSITDQPKESDGTYNLFGNQFSQFAKVSNDVRYYHEVNDKSQFVYRLAAGIGVPLRNSPTALPFDRSFFVGGTNGLRAWQARSIGPGSYYDPNSHQDSTNFLNDKIGEILLEGNIEYRFDLLGFIDGAFFIDAGNVWRLEEDSLRPGSKFELNDFYSEIAVGSGFGMRFDLDFFIIRFDIGIPIRNPGYTETRRWIWQTKGVYNNFIAGSQLNIGIGYPF